MTHSFFPPHGLLTVLLLLLAFPALGKDCPPWETARNLYAEGKVRQAVAVLQCELKARPQNNDARLTLSNILWWNGITSGSRREAEIVLERGYDDFVTRRILQGRVRPWVWNLSLHRVNSSLSTGLEIVSNLSWRYLKKNQVSVGLSQFQRLYPDVAPLVDEAIKLGHLAELGASSYVEAEIEIVPGAEFLPNWRLGVTPHYVFSDESDVSLSVRVSRYPDPSTTFLLAPGWRKHLGWGLDASVTAYINFDSGNYPTSGLFGLSYLLFPRTRLEGKLGLGKTLEAPGVADSFHSWTIGVQQWVADVLSFRADVSRHSGDLRQETRAGIGVDCIF